MANLSNLEIAADAHNVLGGGTSWERPTSWTDKLGNAGKFITTSLLSGANSYYNTAATIGNWAGLDIQERDTEKWISSMDRDWGRYYSENKDLVDVTGFVIGSVVPGIAGMKAVQGGQALLRGAVQSGKITGNLASATGLLVPKGAQYLDEAAGLIKNSMATTGVMNTKTVQALASGFHQNVLEAAAGEILATAVMFKSPVLEDMSITDLSKNIMMGAALGGVFGGILDGAKTVGTLRKVQGTETRFRMPWMRSPELSAATPSADRAIQVAADLELTAFPVRIIGQTAEEDARLAAEFTRTTRLYNDKVNIALNDVRSSLNKMSTSGATDVTNMLADLSMPVRQADGQLSAGFSDTLFQNLSGAKFVGRISDTSPLEIKVGALLRKGEIEENPLAFRFVKLHGEGAGNMLDEMPTTLGLGDLHKSPEAVMAAVRAKKFSVKELFDATALTGQRAYLQMEERMVWALHSQMLKAIPEGTAIHSTDIPLLTRAYMDGMTDIKILKGTDVITPGSTKELLEIIKESKIDLAVAVQSKSLSKKGVDAAEQAARMADVRVSWLQGNQAADEMDDIFASFSSAKERTKLLQERELPTTDEVHPLLRPSYAKITYQVPDDLKQVNKHVLDALAHYKEQQQVFQQQARHVTAKWLGQTVKQLPDYLESALARLDGRNPASGMLSSADANYGSTGAISIQVGKVTTDLKQRFAKEATEALTPFLQRLGAKPEAAIEYASLSQIAGRTTDLLVPLEINGERGLASRAIANAIESGDEAAAEAAMELLEAGKTWHPIKHSETWDAVQAHVALEGKSTQMFTEINAALGKTTNKHSNVFRPVRQDPKDYPYFAFVYDPRVTSSGHVSMIHAASEKELAALIEKVPESYKVSASPEVAGKIKVRTKIDTENFYKARGDYEFDRTLNENYINRDLASKGAYSDYFPKSDPQKIINDALQYHLRRERVAATELVRLHYQPTFDMLEDIGDRYAKYATSKFASRADTVKEGLDNPYYNQVKTALGISTLNESHLWASANKLLDSAVTKAHTAIAKAVHGAKSPDELAAVNQMLDEFGMKPAYYDASLELLANHTAPKGILTEFVRKANSMLSLFTLGLDPLNAINNAIGSNILRSPEIMSLTRAIKAGNEELAGDLAKLAKVKLPGGDLGDILSHQKLVGNAIEALVKDGANGPIKARYKEWGIIKDRVEQLALLIDDFTLRGTESVAELQKREASAWAKTKDVAANFAEAGEKYSGNKYIEEANRFISAHVAEQITTLAQKHGLMDARTAQAYINNFVNRTEGTILASQRPLVFQGPIGQAVGLFQRYQFHLLQQMFRHLSEGSKKDVAMMMGLQATLYGAQGLPAFQFINTHLIGQMSGNNEHKDLYSYTYGTLGKTAADWFMYGMPSNILNTNLYSRGDINPRHLTILPTNLQEIPLVQGWGKLFGSLHESVKKMGAGADAWETVLQGIEHNGISRPLAGLAQVMQATGPEGKVYSTSNRGGILWSNDLWSFATITRLAGGRPLDEARVNDQMARIRVYDAVDRRRREALGEAVKTTLIQGNEPSAEQIESFAEKYAKAGGRQEGFNQWMLRLYKDANVSQAQQLEMNLKSPYSKHMQLLLGGSEGDE